MVNKKGKNVAATPTNLTELLQRLASFTISEQERNPSFSSQRFNHNAFLQSNVNSQNRHGDREVVKQKRTRRKPRKKKQADQDDSISMNSFSSSGSITATPVKSRLFFSNIKKQHYPDQEPSCSKTTQSVAQSDATQFYKFSLKPVTVFKNSILIRKRTNSQKYINLKSFINGPSPRYIFESKISSPDKGLGQKISNHNCEKVNLRKYPIKQPRREKKGGKENEDSKFQEYLTEAEVQKGLSEGTLIKGYIRVNPKNFREAFVSNEDTSIADYYITSLTDRNRALDGDEVVLKIKPKDEWMAESKTARVVYIKQKIHSRTAVGTLKSAEKHSEYTLFLPRDKRFPVMRISQLHWPNGFKENPKDFEKILFVAKLLEWSKPAHAQGIIIEKLGQSGDLKVETMSILRECNLDITPFSEELKENLPQFKGIPEKEYEYREDLRSKFVMTIDPATARDLDDAVSVERLPNKNYEIGVHISDASFYLEEGTELDQVVSKKATTIYLVDSVYHMLPQEMCLGCSLLPGQDKLSFSVIWEMTPDGEVISTRFTRSIINSSVKLSYEHAQMVIENPDEEFTTEDFPQIYNGFEPTAIVETIIVLQGVAKILRENRFKNGALRIDNLKLSFALSPETGQPLDFSVYENKDSHRLIEEFMLLANISVAQKIYDDLPQMAFLRCHEPPKKTMLDALKHRLALYGIHLNISSAGAIASSLKKYLTDDFAGYSRGIVLHHLTSKTMTRAKYFCSAAAETESDFKHYALSVPIYTHFTSPIRRYADIMVHRLLAACLYYRDIPQWDLEYVEAIAKNCNTQKYQAKLAGDASMELYLAHYVEQNKPFVQDCVVVDVKEKKFDAIVLKTGSVVRIHPNNCENGTKWRYEPNKLTITFPKSKRSEKTRMTVELFSLVKVDLTKKDSYNLEGILVRPESESPKSRKNN